MPAVQYKGRWYPTKDQLNSPDKILAAMKRVLDQHYSLIDHLAAASSITGSKEEVRTRFPVGSGPADSIILGLRIAPVDVASLTDGATLKFDKKNGNFHFV